MGSFLRSAWGQNEFFMYDQRAVPLLPSKLTVISCLYIRGQRDMGGTLNYWCSCMHVLPFLSFKQFKCVCVARRLSAVTVTHLRPTSHPSHPPRGHPGNRRQPRLAPVLSLSWSILQHFLPIHSGHTLTSLIITANTAAGAPRAPTTHTHTNTHKLSSVFGQSFWLMPPSIIPIRFSMFTNQLTVISIMFVCLL